MLTNRQPISREAIGPLLVQPVEQASVALSTSTVVATDGYDFRVPIVVSDPVAGWFAEGAEIDVSDPTLAEITVVPSKVAGITVISNELAMDSSPAAAAVVGQGLARDIARKVDTAFFGDLPTPAPPGLASVTGVQAVTGALNNLDNFATAIALAENEGATVTTFAANPATVLSLATVKEADGSNRPLLGSDATVAGERRILGVPLVSSPAVQPGVVWAYDSAKVWAVMRKDATLEVDASPFFTSDRTAVKATMRIGFAFGHPQSIVRISAA